MRRLLPFFAVLLISGCGLLSQPKPEPSTQYQLTPVSASSMAASASQAAPACMKVLRIRGVEANPPYASDNLLYTETSQVLSRFAWHRWATPPATMLTGDILARVTASGVYRAVLGPTDPGEAGWVLAVRINRGPLQVFTGGQGGSKRQSTELLDYTATLADASDGSVIGTRVFSGSRAADPTPYGGAQAASAIVAQLDGELVDWLRGVSTEAACK